MKMSEFGCTIASIYFNVTNIQGEKNQEQKFSKGKKALSSWKNNICVYIL